MERKNGFTKLLALIGTSLVWFPILIPFGLATVVLIQRRVLRFDYLMPAELFPVALVGGGLLIWAALRAHAHVKLISFGFSLALVLLVGGQALAVVTGLASGALEPTGGWWALVVASLVGYTVALVVVGVGGVWLWRDLFAASRPPALRR